MHKTAEEPFARYVEQGRWPLIARVPRCSDCISKEEQEWWTVHGGLFPKETRCPENLLRSGRILSIHMVARHALISQYYES